MNTLGHEDAQAEDARPYVPPGAEDTFRWLP
jgi:hypothetical protein